MVTTPGHTLTVAFNDRCRNYLVAFESEGICFNPLPVETLGGWHKRAAEELRKLARAQARSSGKEEDQSVRQLFQRYSVLLVKGNAALLLNRNPSFPSPPVEGDLPLLIREIFHASLQRNCRNTFGKCVKTYVC